MSSSRLYLKNLPPSSSASRDDVYNYLERFGRLTELKIIESDSFNYGFAQFSSEQDAKYVLDTFRNRLFLGHRTVIELARPLRKDMPSIESHSSRSSDSHARSPRSIQPKYYPNRAHQCRYPVLVANIPRHICWQELKDFGRLAGGLVAYCDLDRNKNGRGFIEYLSREDAEEAVRTLNGQKLGGRPVRVLAHSKDPRRSSRSRSPMRRSSRQTHNTQTDDESANGPSYYGSHYAFPMVTPGYSQQSSPKPSSSPDIITSTLYSNDPALPAVLPSNLHAFSKTVNSYRTGLFSEIVAQGSAFMLQTSSYPDSSQPVGPPAVAETSLINDSYDFDGYLRLSYERSRMAGCYS